VTRAALEAVVKRVLGRQPAQVQGLVEVDAQRAPGHLLE